MNNTYIIENEKGEIFEVKFATRRSLEIWIETERNLFGKSYIIVS